MANERVQRLQPKGETLRELYLKSGNQCAYPDCTRLMIDSEGTFIGQVCHIEAAEEGGERFNESQTNEERRQFANLMLMCYEHHVKTDDGQKYTVEVLREMKKAHEAKFTDIADAIGKAIADIGEGIPLEAPQTLQRMNEILGWGHSDEDLASKRKELMDMAVKVQKLPIRTRQLLVVVISRLKRHVLSNNRYDYDHEIQFREIAEAANLDDLYLLEHVNILAKYDIGLVYKDNGRIISLKFCKSGWYLWGDLNEFCRRTGDPLRSIIVDLKFNLLD
jgi:hypothetical protein